MSNLSLSFVLSSALVSLFVIPNIAVVKHKHLRHKMEQEAKNFYSHIYHSEKVLADAFDSPVLSKSKENVLTFETDVPNQSLFTTNDIVPIVPRFPQLMSLDSPQYKLEIKNDPPDSNENPNDRLGDATTQEPGSPMWLENPSNMVTTYELAPDGKGYYIYERVGLMDVRPPSYISLEDYLELRRKQDMDKYYKEQSLVNNKSGKPKSLIPTIELAKINDVFGGGAISITPTGSASLQFSIDRNKIQNPSLPLRQQKNTFFNFDQQLQVGVVGNIGDKLKVNLSQDTKATFDFENITKIDYTGDEDQILQRFESGQVSMTLGNSLIQGSGNLFGLKAGLKFGPVNVIGLASMDRGQRQTINVKGTGDGLQVESVFKKNIADYDANRHFFLSHFFRSKYDEALAKVPQIYSRVNITQVEVWVTNQNFSQATNLRPTIGFIDMGENTNSYAGGKGVIFNPNIIPSATNRLPDKDANNLYQKLRSNPDYRDQSKAAPALEASDMRLVNGVDFQLVSVRKLQEGRDFTIDKQLGFVSLNSPLQSDDALFVSYAYTYDDKALQVGEFSNDVPGDTLNATPLFLKMIRPTQMRPTYNNAKYPVWDLMMKNVYNIAYGLKPDGFRMQVLYETGTKAGKINSLPKTKNPVLENTPLLQVAGLDRLTNSTAPDPDNLFDFLPGLTVVPDRGYIMFPHIEPFGNYLAKVLNDPYDSSKYVFQPLYDMTYQDAIQKYPELNRFTLEGTYQGGGIGASGGAEIPLNAFNVTPSSVSVSANGVRLTQGIDYDVDPSGTKVIIKNAAYLAQGQTIKVDVNAQQAFQMQTKTMMGFRADYSPIKNTKVGFTVLRLNERPTNFKTTIGDEPFRNTLWGFDVSSQRDLPFLTKAIDRLPFFTTKAPSSMNFLGEWAQFKPGMPKQLQQDSLQGITFIDDFEASKQTYNMTSSQRWKLASFPQHLPVEDSLYDPKQQYPNDKLAAGYSRALLSWYSIDPQVFNPQYAKIPQGDKYNSYTRAIDPREIYPQKTVPAGSGYQQTLDLHYYPDRRGPYNYQYHPEKLNAEGIFTNPRENWAGIMADINTNIDFEAQNVEFIEFWMLDPFLDQFRHNGDDSTGKLYLHLGNISEDIIPDNLQFFENGLPLNGSVNGTVATDWGYVGASTPAANTFSNDAAARTNQDVGLDGLSSAKEREHFKEFVDNIALNFGTSSTIYNQIQADPSTDDYQHYISQEYDNATAGIMDRYAHYYGTEGNSPVGKTYNGLTQQATAIPDIEDLNKNGSPNTWEEYYQYPIDISNGGLRVGEGYVVDKYTSIPNLNATGSIKDTVTWYQFRIPIRSGKPINNIPNFKVINFLRMYMKGFQHETVLRFADFQTVSTQWRKFEGALMDTLTTFPEPCGSFNVGSVSIEDNSKKRPFNYVSPPGVNRQGINGNTTQGLLQDERSLLLRASCLGEGDGRAIFKYVNQDFRNYKKLRMWVHAENPGEPTTFDRKGDAVAFIRLGLDNDFNYYEYEIPLSPSNETPQTNIFNADSIWKNKFDFEFQDLLDAKNQRDLAAFATNYRYLFENGLPEGHKIYIKGTPKLSDVRVIMIGMRNPTTPAEGNLNMEMWIDELSLTKMDVSSAWAANATLNLKLADVGTIQASLQHRTAGFGAIDMRAAQRSREDITRYSVAGDFQLQKFFPQKWGIQMPLHVNLDDQIKNPIYDPREADIKTKDLYKLLPAAERKAEKMAIQDYTSTRGFSFNNIKKNKTGKGAKSHPWDIENIDASFSYSQTLHRDYMIEKNFTSNYRGSLNYRYTIKSPNIQPFKKWKHKNPISEFNFSPLPKSVTVSLLGDRQFSEYLYRPIYFGGKVTPVYTKNFVLTRNYNLAWDLTKSLSMNFTAANNARVDEVKGYWETADQWRKDSIGSLAENLFHYGQDSIVRDGFKPDGTPYRYVKNYNKLLTMGRTIGYNHNINVAYTLPFSKFKPTDWITGNATYAGTFQWINPPETNRGLGATIVNGQNITGTGRLDFNSLYGKWKPLKKMLDPLPYKPPVNKTPDKEKDKQDKKDAKNPTVDQASGKTPIKKPIRPINPDWKDKYKLHPPKELRLLKAILRTVVRLVLSVKSADITYNKNAGTTLPGYLPGNDNLGMDFRFRDTTTGQMSIAVPPTWGFVGGLQQDIRTLARDNRWITKDSTMSNYFQQMKTEQLTLKSSIEPLPGFKIDLNATRNITDNYSEMIRWQGNTTDGDYINTAIQFTGSHTMSYVFFNTAFIKEDPNKDDSPIFDKFSQNRKIISQRLFQTNAYSATIGQDITSDGYQNGYYRTSQEVLIPAMLASYGVIGAEKISLTAFPKIPLPNWSVNFNPTIAFPQLKQVFSSISIKHTYQGTYTVSNYNRNIFAEDYNGDLLGDVAIPVQLTTPLPGAVQPLNFAPVRNIAIVQMQEKFAPLIGVNTTFKNGMTANLSFNKARMYSFNVGTMQMSEEKSQDVTFGLTYKKDKLNMNLHLFNKDIHLKNSANFGIQFSFRENYLRNRTMDGAASPVLRGNSALNFNPSIDYVISNRVNVKLFWIETINKPLSGSYPNSFRSVGVQVRLSLN